MPEADTMCRVARRLDRDLAGRRLAGGELRAAAFAATVFVGTTVLAHDTHRKHLWTRFDDGRTRHIPCRRRGLVGAARRAPSAAGTRPPGAGRLGLANGPTAYGLGLPVVELLATAVEVDARRAPWPRPAALELGWRRGGPPATR